MLHVLFAHYLRSRGVEALALSQKLYRKLKFSKSKFVGGLIHALLNEIVRGNAVIVRAARGSRCLPISLCYGLTLCLESSKGLVETSYLALARGEASYRNDVSEVLELRYVLNEFLRVPPYIVLDFSLWELHREDERGEAYKQLVVLIDTVTRYLTEINVVLVNPPRSLVQRLRQEFGYGPTIVNCVGSECERTLDFEVLVLDPYASDVLRREDVFSYDAFVMGMIIDDKVPRPYSTKLIQEVNWPNSRSARLELWGSKVGVPNRVNKIAEMLLKVRLLGLDLERALLDSMSKYDKFTRLHREVYAYWSKHGRVDVEYLRTVCELLELDMKECVRVLRARGIPFTEE